MNRALEKHVRDPLNLIALVGAVVWSATAILGRPIGDFGVETDFYGDVVPKARQWMQGTPVLSAFRGPFYYLVIGFLEVVFRDAFLAGKLLSAFSAAVALRLAGGLLRRLFSPMVGVGGALFLAANAHLVAYSFRACTDLFFLSFFLGVLSLVLSDRETGRRWLLAGLLAGAAWLTRYNGLALLPAVAGIALLTVRPFSRSVGRLLLFLAGWAALALPWALFLWRETGDPLWNANFRNIATEVYTFNPSMAVQGKFWSSVGFESLREVYQTDPGRFLSTMASNLGTHVWRDAGELVGWFWSGAALLGLVLTGKMWRTRRNLAFALAGLLTYLALIPVFYNARFMLPLLLWWGVGIGGLASFINDRFAGLFRKKTKTSWWPGEAAVSVMVVLVALAAVANGREIGDSTDPSHTSKSSPQELLGLAERARQTGLFFGSSTPIAALKPHIAYYLDAPYLSIPFGSFEDLRKAGAHYLLASSAEATVYSAMRELAWLRKPSDVPPGLRFVARYASPVDAENSRVASLYAIDNPIPWTPPSSRPTPPTGTTLPGLSRVDYLRLQLVRWYHLWEPFQDSKSLLAKMSPSAQEHPLVLQVKGDGAVIAKDLELAEGYYRQAANLDPRDATALLGVATARYLRGDNAGFNAAITEYGAIRKMASDSLQGWFDLGHAMALEGRYAMALPSFVICYSVAPEQSRFVENLGFALQTLAWYDRARTLYEGFLKQYPDDVPVRNALDGLELRGPTPDAGG